MTSREEIFVTPPPGPLAWLYPEILDPPREDFDPGVLERTTGVVRIEDGPRGYALWTWLRQAFRGRDVELIRPSLNGTRCLEARLTAMKCALPFHPGEGLKGRIVKVLEKAAADPKRWRKAELMPFFVTRLERGEDAQTRLAPSWWGILPGDAWPAEERRLFHELFRLLRPDRIFLYKALENYALAGIDCYVEGLMGRSFPLFTAKGALPLVIGVCGTDGSGKSSHVAALREHIAGLGLRVCVHKIYRHGVFHDTVTDLTRQCAGGKNLHLWRLQRVVKAFDSVKYLHSCLERDLASHDVVLFDRYTFTHYAAGVGRYHHDPFVRELLCAYPEPDRIYLLDVPTEEALKRIGAREERTVDENPYMLSRYRHALLDLGRRHGFVILDAMKPFEENRRLILEDADRLLKERGLA